MAEFSLEYTSPIFPAEFFEFLFPLKQIAGAKPGKLHRSLRLPDLSSLIAEENFADVYMGWNERGLFLFFEINAPFNHSAFPDFRSADSVELFIDTRDLKTNAFTHRFCHHFIILPQEIDGIKSQEVTKFRMEESHPLCDPSELHVDVEFHKKSYEITVHIPSHCLFGFDPKTFDRIGFAYRLNRYGNEAQHFVLSSDLYAIEKQPQLWPSFQMIPV